MLRQRFLSQKRLIIGREGLVLCGASASSVAATLGWSEIGKAVFDWELQRLTIYAPDGSRVFARAGEEFGSNRLAEECAEEINEGKRVYTRLAARV